MSHLQHERHKKMFVPFTLTAAQHNVAIEAIKADGLFCNSWMFFYVLSCTRFSQGRGKCFGHWFVRVDLLDSAPTSPTSPTLCTQYMAKKCSSNQSMNFLTAWFVFPSIKVTTLIGDLHITQREARGGNTLQSYHFLK